MTQASIEFSSLDELNDFVEHVQPFVIEKNGTTVFGIFTDKQLELARNGFNAKIDYQE